MMKISRLIGIITILLQREKVTASFLAERFEVSRRTVNRDIEELCKAGIPVITLQGVNGGIMLSEDFKIDKIFFSEEELMSILVGLKSLESVSTDRKYKNIIDKFISKKSGVYQAEHILIDLSSHYKNSLAPKIDVIKEAIETSFKIKFTYFNSSGENIIILEPYFIVFQWSSWYVFGFNDDKNEFRLYKLNRLWHLEKTEDSFILKSVKTEDLSFNSFFTDEIKAVIIFEATEKFRLIEEYGINCFTTLFDGRLHFEFPFTNSEYLINWVLSFGDTAELIEPVNIRTEITERLKNTLKKYL